MSSSTPPTSKTASSSSSQSYINKFGYHFAKKLLGGGTLHNSDDGPFFYPQSTTTKTTTNKSSTNKCLVFYRANWRSNIHKFPWDLSSTRREDGKHDTNDCTSTTLSSSEAESTSMSLQRIIEAETMFIDVTFDFACLHSSSNDGSNTTTATRIKDKVRVISTAVRIGAVVALPTDNNDGYQYYYLRGKPLTAHDIHEHCRTMDVDPENTPVEILAEMLAHSFQMSLNWRIVGQCDDVESKNQYRWEMTIGHSGELEGEVSTFSLCTGTWYECLGDVLSSRILDVIFLQWRRTRGEKIGSGEEGNDSFVRLSQEEGRSFWSDLTNDGDWMEVITSGDVEDVTLLSSSLKETASVDIAQKNHTKQSEEPPSHMDNGNTNVKKTARLSSSSSHGNKMSTRPSKPSETVMYAHGKRTCIAGSKKKKKAKFTLGSI